MWFIYKPSCPPLVAVAIKVNPLWGLNYSPSYYFFFYSNPHPNTRRSRRISQKKQCRFYTKSRPAKPQVVGLLYNNSVFKVPRASAPNIYLFVAIFLILPSSTSRLFRSSQSWPAVHLHSNPILCNFHKLLPHKGSFYPGYNLPEKWNWGSPEKKNTTIQNMIFVRSNNCIVYLDWVQNVCLLKFKHYNVK